MKAKTKFINENLTRDDKGYFVGNNEDKEAIVSRPLTDKEKQLIAEFENKKDKNNAK